MKEFLKKITPAFLKRHWGTFSVAKELSKETGISYWALLFDMNLSVLSCVTPYEYKMYRFYEKSRRARDQFMTDHRKQKMMRVFNSADRSLIKNKHEFNRLFSDFVGRQWLYAPDVSDQQIKDFLDIHKQIIVKPNDGSEGKGIYKVSPSELTDMEAFCESARKNCLILEEIIEQHPALSAINPASVNTMRITVVVDRVGVPHCLSAGLRMGRGQTVTDNLSVNGLIAQIDMETGILFTPAIGADLQTYIKHPVSGIILPGFQIPHWEAVKTMVFRAAKIAHQHQLRWIGWDVAVTEGGPLLIEGNSRPNPRTVQMATQTGYYHILRSYL